MSTLTTAAANGLGNGGGTLVPDLSALDSSARKAKTPSELHGAAGLAAAAAPSGGRSKALAIVATAPGTSEPLLDDSFFALMKVGRRV